MPPSLACSNRLLCLPPTAGNRFILAISLGVGLGVTVVPEWAEGGGIAAFYGGNLRHNYGLMPAKDACLIFPKKTIVTKAAFCRLSQTNFPASKSTCKDLGGKYTAEVTATVEEKNCVNNNGFCCIKYDANRKMWRDTVVIIMKTPYCIGTLIALLLNTILPDEDVRDAARAFARAMPLRCPCGRSKAGGVALASTRPCTDSPLRAHSLSLNQPSSNPASILASDG